MDPSWVFGLFHRNHLRRRSLPADGDGAIGALLRVLNDGWKRWDRRLLAGGFKYFLFSPLFGEDSHFD